MMEIDHDVPVTGLPIGHRLVAILLDVSFWTLCVGSLVGSLSASSDLLRLVLGTLAAVAGGSAIGRLFPRPTPAMRVVLIDRGTSTPPR
jgi:hypothetical protein